MQQDSDKARFNSDQKLHCESHPECELQILYFGQKKYGKSRMLCVQCLIKQNNNKEYIDNSVYLQEFLNDPKNSIMRIFDKNNNDSQSNIQETMNKIEKLLQSFEEAIQICLIKIRYFIDQIKILQEQVALEFANELKLGDVAKQIQILKQMDSCQGTNELDQLENQLNFISDNLTKAYIKQKNMETNNQNQIESNIIDHLTSINQEAGALLQEVKNLTPIFNQFQSPLDDIKDFPQIHQQISEGKQVKYNLIFQGTRDGLNGQAYWSKCNLQDNLLTIMTSKNGNRFGGYSPCKINQQLNYYVQDPTMKSFIFQYNKKEIYKLKQKEYAVFCHQTYGPTFGYNCDIYVQADFQSGQSHTLGTTYDISGYNIQDKATHIFGAASPQLQECKVYKVLFY